MTWDTGIFIHSYVTCRWHGTLWFSLLFTS